MQETLDRYLEEAEDATRISAPHATLDDVDLRGGASFDRIDLHCTALDTLRAEDITADHFYGWKMDVSRSQFTDATIRRLNLRDTATRFPLRLDRVEAETVDLADADYPHATLTEADIDTLHLRGSEGSIVNLRGAAVGTIRGDTDNYHVLTDADTYVHDVPDELASDLGYRGVSEDEAWVLHAAEGYEDGFTFDDLQRDYKSAVHRAGTLGPLVQRDFLAHDGDRFELTGRGRAAAAYHGGDEA